MTQIQSIRFVTLASMIAGATFAFSGPVHAGAVWCNGSTSLPSGLFSGSCSNGHCSGFLSGASLFAFGSCSDGVRFNGSSLSHAQFVSGDCRNGNFHAYLSGERLSFSGDCSNGGAFNGNAYTGGGSISGTCSENGSFSAYISGSTASVNGSCTTADELELDSSTDE